MTRSIGPCWKCSLPSASSRAAGRPGSNSATGALIWIGDQGGRPWVRPGSGLAQDLAAHALGALDVDEFTNAVHMAAHGGIVGTAHGELDRPDDRRRWHEAEGLVRHRRDVDHEGDAAARPDIDRRAA